MHLPKSPVDPFHQHIWQTKLQSQMRSYAFIHSKTPHFTADAIICQHQKFLRWQPFD